ITFPSGKSQEDLLRNIYREANVDPRLVHYVEAHGTGTKAGDPQELEAIANVFCQPGRQGPLKVGSVRSNVGHNEVASGLTWEEAEKRCRDGVVLACHNAEDSVTVSGPADAVAQLVEELKAEGAFVRTVDTMSVAFHSRYVENVVPALREALEKSTEDVVEVDLGANEGDAYLAGHQLDGRILFPATGYIVMAWRHLAKRYGKPFHQVPVILEDVTVHRATILPKREATGEFVVSEAGTVVCTGRIRMAAAGEKVLEKGPPGPPPETVVYELDAADFYKELRLRGYEYQGAFQGVLKTDLESCYGRVKWEDNWVTFIDNIMQLSLLPYTDRVFRLPVKMRSCRVDPNLHKQVVRETHGAGIPVVYDSRLNACRAGGVAILGLEIRIAPRRPAQQGVCLEEYKFVPYIDDESAEHQREESVREYIDVCNAVAGRLFAACGEQAVRTQLTKDPGQVSENALRRYREHPAENHIILRILTDIEKNVKNTSSDLGCAVHSALTTYEQDLKNDLLNTALFNGVPKTMTEYAFLNVETRGDLSSLRWYESPLRCASPPSGFDGILCSVYYAPVNSRDVLLATGKLPLDVLPGCNKEREFLKHRFSQLEDRNIADVQDLSFEEHVLRETKHRGVDVVLNSLFGEKLEASVRCLATNGRFLDVGKFDVAKDFQLGMSFFRKSATFCGIHLETLHGKDPAAADEKRRVRDLVEEGIVSGTVRPLDTVRFRREEAEEAFRFMDSGEHTGKVILEVREEETTRTTAPASFLAVEAAARTWFYEDKSYVIIGGLGGFGLELANWMVGRGCRSLLLSSRSGVRTGYQKLQLRRWHAAGAKVRVTRANASTACGARKIIDEASTKGAVGGIFNLGLVLCDALLESQSPEAFEAVCRVKVDGTRHLDELSRKLCPELDHFVAFSSLASGHGNIGQTGYGYANAAIERICERRVADGLPEILRSDLRSSKSQFFETFQQKRSESDILK
ncbi:hypothetical protein V5799_006327, partial [Amblyomma americanum]